MCALALSQLYSHLALSSIKCLPEDVLRYRLLAHFHSWICVCVSERESDARYTYILTKWRKQSIRFYALVYAMNTYGI